MLAGIAVLVARARLVKQSCKEETIDPDRYCSQGFIGKIMHGPQMHVAPTPTSKMAHKLVTLCTVSMALANHNAPRHVGVDATFSKTSLHNALSYRQGGVRFFDAASNFLRIGIKFNMTPNGECQKTGPVRILVSRHLCENPYNPTVVFTICLSCAVAPEWIRAPSSLVLTVGETGSVECAAAGRDLNVTWTANGKSLSGRFLLWWGGCKMGGVGVRWAGRVCSGWGGCKMDAVGVRWVGWV